MVNERIAKQMIRNARAIMEVQVAAHGPPRFLGLWLFPESEWEKWTKLDGCGQEMSYDTYVHVQHEIAAYAHRRYGTKVQFWHGTVAELAAELERQSLPNNSQNRATVIGLMAAKAKKKPQNECTTPTVTSISNHYTKQALEPLLQTMLQQLSPSDPQDYVLNFPVATLPFVAMVALLMPRRDPRTKRLLSTLKIREPEGYTDCLFLCLGWPNEQTRDAWAAAIVEEYPMQIEREGYMVTDKVEIVSLGAIFAYYQNNIPEGGGTTRTIATTADAKDILTDVRAIIEEYDAEPSPEKFRQELQSLCARKTTWTNSARNRFLQLTFVCERNRVITSDEFNGICLCLSGRNSLRLPEIAEILRLLPTAAQQTAMQTMELFDML